MLKEKIGLAYLKAQENILDQKKGKKSEPN